MLRFRQSLVSRGGFDGGARELGVVGIGELELGGVSSSIGFGEAMKLVTEMVNKS